MKDNSLCLQFPWEKDAEKLERFRQVRLDAVQSYVGVFVVCIVQVNESSEFIQLTGHQFYPQFGRQMGKHYFVAETKMFLEKLETFSFVESEKSFCNKCLVCAQIEKI